MLKQINEMLRSDYLTAQEITNLVIKFQKSRQHDKKQEYKDAVFSNVVRLIAKRAAQHASKNRQLDYDDLFQAGVMGFCEAIEKFKIKKKTMFSTYLEIWIKKYMCDLAYDSHLIYTPKNVIQYAFQQEKKEMEGKKAKHTERSQQFWDSKHMIYLDSDKPLEERHGADTNMHNLIKSAIEIDAEIDEGSRDEYLQRLIKRYLNESEQQVLQLRYFNGTGDVQKLHSVGEQIHLSTERVRQIEFKALAKLKKRSRGLIQ